MTIIKKEDMKEKGITIDCTGPDGNAYYLLNACKTMGKLMDWNDKEIEKVMDEMKSSDYEHLIQTFDKNFGFYVTLIR